MSGAAPQWPMLLQYAGLAELRVVRDQDEWDLDPDLRGRPFRPEDRLIDSAGVEYRASFTEGRNRIVATGRRCTPEEVQSIANRHIAELGAEPEWLASHLREIAAGLKIKATLLYLSKLAAADASSDTAEDE